MSENTWDGDWADGYRYEEDPDYDDEATCASCGPWCEHWAGDGLCMVAIEEQARQREEYLQRHVNASRCPVCGDGLTMYDVYAGEGEPWAWSAGFYDPMIAVMDVMGPMWLRKGVLHGRGRVYHVWIEWGTGREERLLRYLEADPPKTKAA